VFAALVASIVLFLANIDGVPTKSGSLPYGVEGRGVGADDAAHNDVPVEGGVA
jgi:hypothetical protein